jgi:hypothetical protein
MSTIKHGVQKSTWLSALSDDEIKASIPPELGKALAEKDSQAELLARLMSRVRPGRKANKPKVEVQPGLVKALQLCENNESELARALGVTPQAVQQWFKKGYVPDQRGKEIWEMFGIPPSETCRPLTTQKSFDEPPRHFTDLIAKTIETKGRRKK